MKDTVRPQAHWENRFSPGRMLIYGVLLVIFIITAYPFLYVLFLAVMPYDQFISQPVHLLPSGFTTLYFEQIIRDQRLFRGFQISILKTVIGTLLSVVVTVMGGYALSRPQLRFGKLLNFLFLIPMFAGAGLIPSYLNIRSVGLLNTFWALILPGMVAPFYVFLTRTYFSNYPQELIEAATIDGASPFGVFWRVIWPTSIPIIATLGMLYGVSHWNEYFWPSILVQAELQPASVLLQNMITTRSVLSGLGQGVQMTQQSFIAAVAAMMIVPILILYPLLQRYVVAGILVGSVKE